MMHRAIKRGGAMALVATVAVCGATHRLVAQVPAPTAVDDSTVVAESRHVGVRPGARVRVTDRAGRRMSGRVWSVTADSLRLGLDSEGFAAFAWSDVRSYEVAQGRAVGQSAARGAIVGGAVGTVLVALAIRSDAETRGDVIFPAIALATPVAVLLTGLGAGIGAVVAPTRWGEGIMVNRQAASTGRPNGPTEVAGGGARWRVGWSARF